VTSDEISSAFTLTDSVVLMVKINLKMKSKLAQVMILAPPFANFWLEETWFNIFPYASQSPLSHPFVSWLEMCEWSQTCKIDSAHSFVFPRVVVGKISIRFDSIRFAYPLFELKLCGLQVRRNIAARKAVGTVTNGVEEMKLPDGFQEAADSDNEADAGNTSPGTPSGKKKGRCSQQ
jgi:hypothetical protein